MHVSFPSLRDLTPSDRRILAPAFGAAAVAARRQGKRALDCLYSSLTEALLGAPYPDAVALDALADLDDDEVERLIEGLSVQITREAKEGTVSREALFSDLALALAAERRRREHVLRRLAAAMDWYDANWPSEQP
ncbi:MAG TPA: hypothetical protein VGL23_02140 [Chloroflexota bacterium]|jgi:hypothetical protein